VLCGISLFSCRLESKSEALRRHVHELNHVEAGLVLGGLTAANGGFNPGTELMDALFDAVISEQVALLHPSRSSHAGSGCWVQP